MTLTIPPYTLYIVLTAVIAMVLLYTYFAFRLYLVFRTLNIEIQGEFGFVESHIRAVKRLSRRQAMLEVVAERQKEQICELTREVDDFAADFRSRGVQRGISGRRDEHDD